MSNMMRAGHEPIKKLTIGSSSTSKFDPNKYAGPTTVSAPPQLNLDIQENPGQKAALANAAQNVANWGQYRNRLAAGASAGIAGTMQNLRDLQTGQRAEYEAAARARGGMPAHKTGAFLSQQQRDLAKAGWEAGQQKEALMQGALAGETSGIQGQTSAAEAVQRGAIAHGQLGLGAYQVQVGAWQAANAANMANQEMAFNQLMAVRNAALSSPSRQMYM